MGTRRCCSRQSGTRSQCGREEAGCQRSSEVWSSHGASRDVRHFSNAHCEGLQRYPASQFNYGRREAAWRLEQERAKCWFGAEKVASGRWLTDCQVTRGKSTAWPSALAMIRSSVVEATSVSR